MFKVLDKVCKPTKGSKYSAAVDLYAREDVVIGAGETKIVPLGVCIDYDIDIYIGNRKSNDTYKINKNATYGGGVIASFDKFLKSHYLQLEPRSSLRAKGLQAGTGIIDIDYPDEIMLCLHKPYNLDTTAYWGMDKDKQNDIYNSTNTFTIKKGDKIAQILLKEHKTYLMGIESDEERTGGFGSTGK